MNPRLILLIVGLIWAALLDDMHRRVSALEVAIQTLPTPIQASDITN